MIQVLTAQQALRKCRKPEPIARASNSFWVLSLPPGLCANMITSMWTTFFVASEVSGASGRLHSATITFPFSGRASSIFNDMRQIKVDALNVGIFGEYHVKRGTSSTTNIH
nr:hypothetical protein Csa_3G046225 [Ipomoea batatas]